MVTVSDNIALASYYRLMGAAFWESAKKLDVSMDKREDGTPAKLTAIPFYFLTSHAAELFLKSALFKRGYTEKELMKFDYRHDLNKLLEVLQSKGIVVTPATIDVIHGLATRHKDHSLRYGGSLSDGKPTYWPPTALINDMLAELLSLTKISTQGR